MEENEIPDSSEAEIYHKVENEISDSSLNFPKEADPIESLCRWDADIADIYRFCNIKCSQQIMV